ncbi:MAG: LysR substrate-binding domain-containing protein [Elusimicrobiota bacterium]
MNITLKELQVLVSIKQTGSFSAAADELNLSQPTVSTHISNLEKSLETNLMKRGPGGIKLTRTGTETIKTAKKIIKDIQNLKQRINRIKGLKTGYLNIGASTIPGTYIIPAYIKEFKEKFPNIKINLKIKDSRDIINMLKNGDLDLGFAGYPPKGKLYKKIMARDKIVLAVNREHKWADKKYISVNTLTREPILMREKGSGTRKVFLKHLRRKTSKNLKIYSTLDTSTGMLEAIKTGLAPGIISKIAIRCQRNLVDITDVKIKGLSIKRPFYLILKDYPASSEITREFIKFFK